MALLAGKWQGKYGRMFLLEVTVALFVISAAVPNATIGIGK